MGHYFRNWIERYFFDEAAITLGMVLLFALVILMTLGKLLIPVFASFVVAYLLQGIVNFLAKHCFFPRLLAVSTTFLLFCALLVCMIFMLLPLIWSQVVNLFNELPRMAQQLQNLLIALPQEYPSFVSQAQIDNFVQFISAQIAHTGQWLVSFSFSKLTSIVSLLVYLILVPILVFFFLKDQEYIIKTFYTFLPKNRRLIKQVAAEMNVQIANYIRGKTIEIIIVAVIDYALFLWMGLHYALLLAVLVGLSVVIPYIGAIVVTIPVALMAFFQWGWESQFLLLMTLYMLIQAIDGNIFVPLLFSEVVNLHPVAIITAILIFGGLWGFWGVFFAIPLATLTKAVYSAWPKRLEEAPT